MPRLLSRLALLLAGLSLAACAGEPRTDDVASSLRLFPRTARAVAHRALAAAKPELAVHVLRDDEVVALLGGRLARALLSRAFVVRAEVVVSGELFPPNRIDLFLHASRIGVLPLVTLSPYGVAAAFTHETCAGMREVVTGVNLRRLEFDRDFREPTPAELLATCPDAVALAYALKAPVHDGVSGQTFVVRRPEGDLPVPEGELDIALRRDATCLGARIHVPLAPGVTTWNVAETEDVIVREDDLQLVRPRSCFLPEECELLGACRPANLPKDVVPSVVALTPPKGPERPTTLVESEKQRPPWDDEPFAPTVDVPARVSSAGLAAPDRFVACRVQKRGRARQVATFVAGGTTVTRRLVYDDATDTFLVSFPLIDLPEGGSFAFALHSDGATPLEGRKVVVQRTNDELTLARPTEGPESIRCRGQAQSVLEEEGLRRWARVNDELEPFERSPSGKRADHADVALVQASIRDVAGLLGWDDPRVSNLVARVARAEAGAGR